MLQTIEIENGLVSLIEKSISYSVPLADWLPKIEKRAPINTPVLPSGTRAVSWDPSDLNSQKLNVLIELQPTIINMNFGGIVRHLSIPFTRFMFWASTADPTNNLAWRLEDYRIYWAKTRYQNPDTRDMIPALIPNVYSDGRICFGSTGANADQSIADRLDQTVSEFYISNFNNDLTIRRPNAARSYRQWERMTEKDPTGWMEWRDWDETQISHERYSFNNVINNRGNATVGRFSPMIAPDAIPPVPLGASFGRLQEWLDDLEGSQRGLLLRAMQDDIEFRPERYAAQEASPENEDDE